MKCLVKRHEWVEETSAMLKKSFREIFQIPRLGLGAQQPPLYYLNEDLQITAHENRPDDRNPSDCLRITWAARGIAIIFIYHEHQPFYKQIVRWTSRPQSIADRDIRFMELGYSA